MDWCLKRSTFIYIVQFDQRVSLRLASNWCLKEVSWHAHNFLFSKFSTAERWLIKQHVLTELSGCKLHWQDFTLRDFTDPFLKEHVDFIAICDTEACILEVVKFLALF